MATTDIVQRVKAHVYGQGVGEHPTIILGAADASETVSAPTIAFDVADGTQVQAGDVLGVVNAADADSAFVLYVLSVSTNTVTALMGYFGSPSPTTADDLDGAVFEVNPVKSEWLMWQKVETTIDTLLWPVVYKPNTQSITPNLATGQNEIAATVMDILGAQQQIAGIWENIPFSLDIDVDTNVSSTGNLVSVGAIDGSTVYLKTIERYAASDTMSSALEECIALGAAAQILGATRSSTDLEASSKDSQFRGSRNPAQQLWQDFITLRSSLNDDLAKQVDWFEYHR